MWLDNVSNSEFLTQLFNEVPELVGVEINSFAVKYYNNSIRIIINLPRYVDNIPLKWKMNNYNALTIELDFWAINSFHMTIDDKKISNIEINKVDDKTIRVIISGGINADFTSEYIYIQKVYGYTKGKEESGVRQNEITDLL